MPANPSPEVEPKTAEQFRLPQAAPRGAPEGDSKFFLRSKTVLSALLLALPAILRAFDVQFAESDVRMWGERAATLLGLIGVIYGRVKSTGPLHLGTGVAPMLLALFLAIALLTGCSAAPLKARLTSLANTESKALLGIANKTADAELQRLNAAIEKAAK